MKSEAILKAAKELVRAMDENRCHSEAFDDLRGAIREYESAPNERRIVQITEGGIEGAPGRWDADAWITGLCNDGSVWRLHGGGSAGEVWYRLPPIPQDQPNGVQS